MVTTVYHLVTLPWLKYCPSVLTDTEKICLWFTVFINICDFTGFVSDIANFLIYLTSTPDTLLSQLKAPFQNWRPNWLYSDSAVLRKVISLVALKSHAAAQTNSSVKSQDLYEIVRNVRLVILGVINLGIMMWCFLALYVGRYERFDMSDAQRCRQESLPKYKASD